MLQVHFPCHKRSTLLPAASHRVASLWWTGTLQGRGSDFQNLHIRRDEKHQADKATDVCLATFKDHNADQGITACFFAH